MGNFYRDNRSGGGGNRDFNRRDGGDREMHKATCNNCGKECTVPFKPTGIRPVFCKECFQKNEGSDSRRFSNDDRAPRRPSFERNRNDDRPQNNEQLNAINAKVDKILAILSQNPAKSTSKTPEEK